MRARIEDGVVHSPYPYCTPVHGKSIYEFLMERLLAHGSKTALICGPDQVTYLELRDKLWHCAAWYRRQGVRKGDRVYMHVGNSIENFVAVCSVTLTGATLVSSDCMWSEGELLNKIKKADITHVLTDESHAEMFLQITKRCDIKDVFLVGQETAGFTSVCMHPGKNEFHFEDKDFIDGGCRFVEWTTGTTGTPKCVQNSESSFLGQITCLAAVQLLTTDDVFLGDCNISSFVVLQMWFVALHVGSTIAVSKTCRTVPEDVFDAIKNCEAVAMLGFPLKLKRLLSALKESEDTTNVLKKSLRKVLVIGSITPPALAEEFANIFSLSDFRSCYGMTEAGGFLTVPPSGEVSGTNQGFPIPAIRMKVIDTVSGEVLGPTQCGEVLFHTPYGATAYYGDSTASASIVDKHGWMYTGDLGYYDDDGRLFLCGRLKTMLICQTRKFSASEVEHCLMEHEAVEEVSVLGIPAPDLQDIPAAVVVTRNGYTPDQKLADDLKLHVAERMASFKHLHGGIYFADTLLRNARGKVPSTQLRELLQTQRRADTDEGFVKDCIY